MIFLAVALIRNPAALRVGLRELPMLAIYGLVGVALIQYFYFIAIARLPVGVALLIEFTGVVFVVLYAWLVRGESVLRQVWLAVALCLFGLGLVVQVWRGGGGLDPVGLAAGAASAVALAAYYLMGQRAVRHRDPLSLLCWAFFFAAIFWAVLRPWWVFDASALADPAVLPSGVVPVGLLVTSIVIAGTVAPFFLSLASLRHVSASRAGIVATAEPVLASAVGWLWLGEVLGLAQVVGGLIVVAGIVMVQTAREPAAQVTTA